MKKMYGVFVLGIGLTCLCDWIGGHAQASKHWVTAWATAQDMAPTKPAIPNVPATVKRPVFPANRSSSRPALPTDVRDQTVRMTVKIGLGGTKFRVELSNAFGKAPVLLGAVHIARKNAGSAIQPATDHELTFSGHREVTIPPGAVVVSDVVDLDLPDLSTVAVSVYVKSSEGVATTHALALHTTYITSGNATSAVEFPESSTTDASYLWLSGIDVLASSDRFAIVALGDSITDGFKTTVNANKAWPSLLQDRLLTSKGSPKASVLNEGISGNQVLQDGAGVSALARFDRDVLSRPGVRWIILLEGINDINIHGQVEDDDALTAEDLIAGYRQIVARAHMNNIKVMGATLTPEEGVWLAGPVGEATRQKVNAWIRATGNFDAIVDFDQVLRTPGHEAALRSELDPGDHIHPNDKGNALMAEQFSTSEFRR
ncbi:SGNH/GDSL hydrolase family protein [Terriglobus sp. TAA 43]|uniref:SGNH/GDSL hydrolase family protein n=1 Tax=Terriglobus sp. TAA 43 TaxID=278961 RepID=UPI000A778D9A|nr:SGNH/GDSL hydrolase family protein [Terriglobus sp. TAA 43]